MNRLRIGLMMVLVVTLCTPRLAFADTWGEPINTPGDRFVELDSYGQRPICIIGFSCSVAIYDKETGLVWEQAPDTSGRSWPAAQAWCNAKSLGRRLGWRLPNIQELASLVDPTQSNPSLPTGHPFNVQPFEYWSATSNSDTEAWVVDFRGSGGVFTKGKSEGDLRVWCVRGGQGPNPQ